VIPELVAARTETHTSRPRREGRAAEILAGTTIVGEPVLALRIQEANFAIATLNHTTI